MRMRAAGLSLVLVLPVTSVARADAQRFGIGASVMRPPNVGVSVVTGVSEHHALHLRAARYLPLVTPADDANRVGRIYGASASWVVYANRVLDGASLELGAFVRDTSELGWTDERTRRSSEAIGAHLLAGYTFALDARLYVTFALGISTWLEHGHDVDVDGPRSRPFLDTPRAIDGYFRIGWSIDA